MDWTSPFFLNKVAYFSGFNFRIALTIFQLLVLEASYRSVVFLEKCLLIGCNDLGVLTIFVDILSEYWNFFPFTNKTEVTSVKLVVFKWEKLFDILT